MSLMYAHEKKKGGGGEFIGTWTCMETSWRPSIFPLVARKQRPEKSQKHVYVYTIEFSSSCLCAILDRGPSAVNEFAVHVSHLVLIVRDWVK